MKPIRGPVSDDTCNLFQHHIGFHEELHGILHPQINNSFMKGLPALRR